MNMPKCQNKSWTCRCPCMKFKPGFPCSLRPKKPTLSTREGTAKARDASVNEMQEPADRSKSSPEKASCLQTDLQVVKGIKKIKICQVTHSGDIQSSQRTNLSTLCNMVQKSLSISSEADASEPSGGQSLSSLPRMVQRVQDKVGLEMWERPLSSMPLLPINHHQLYPRQTCSNLSVNSLQSPCPTSGTPEQSNHSRCNLDGPPGPRMGVY